MCHHIDMKTITIREFQRYANRYLKDEELPIRLSKYGKVIAVVIAVDEEDTSLRSEIKDIKKRLDRLEELALNM